MGIDNVFDLLTHYPRLHIDRTRRAELSELSVGETAAVMGEVTTISARRTRQGRALVEVSVADDGGNFRVVFFNQAWRERQLVVGTQALFFGTVSEYRGTRQMTNPVVDVIVGPSGEERDPSRVGRVVAIYPASGKAGLTSWELGGFIEESLRRAGPLLDPLDDATRTRLGLVERTAAYFQIHLPRELADVISAKRRLIFDEFLRLQVLIALRRHRLVQMARGISHAVTPRDLDVAPGSISDPGDSLVRRFLAQHPFAPTSAQRRVLEEIFTDLASDLPMNRLLQGDVGSGKTLVSLVALLGVIEHGRQGVVMAPTEVLAEQHVAALRRDVAGLVVADENVLGGARAVHVALLSGRLRAKERQQVIEGLATGSIDVVVGTHALLGEDVRFRSLGLLVIDEQHRFGVEQRATLRDEGRSRSAEGRDPDLLVMTATPIPRTAAMVLFGDLDLSIIDEMPRGRREIATTWATSPEHVQHCWAHVREEVAKGHRAYVVCPLVEGSERVEATSAVQERTRLALDELRGLSVGLLHGQMRAEEKESVMASFRAGEIEVLVATVVIEVGVDVPEATVIVIEDAWRFGLAQLHQLRGRVGRSDVQSYCYLLGEAPSEESAARLGALVDSNDGFALAEVDLDLRGEGTLLGARQKGRSDLRLANLRRDEELLREAQVLAGALVDEDAEGLAAISDELRLFVDDDEASYLFKS